MHIAPDMRDCTEIKFGELPGKRQQYLDHFCLAMLAIVWLALCYDVASYFLRWAK